jgi:hypothetical protein
MELMMEHENDLQKVWVSAILVVTNTRSVPMYTGKLIFSQVVEHIPLPPFIGASTVIVGITRSKTSLVWISIYAWPLRN